MVSRFETCRFLLTQNYYSAVSFEWELLKRVLEYKPRVVVGVKRVEEAM